MNKEHLKRLDELLKAGVKLGVVVNDKLKLRLNSVKTTGHGELELESLVTTLCKDVSTHQLYANIKGVNMGIFTVEGKFMVQWEYDVPMLSIQYFHDLVDGNMVKIHKLGEFYYYGILISHGSYDEVIKSISKLSPVSFSGNLMERYIARPESLNYTPDRLTIAIVTGDNIYVMPWSDLEYQNCQILIPMK